MPNPHLRPNSDAIVPWFNGLDITRRPRGMWIIDFGTNAPISVASQWEQPFRHVEEEVQPARLKNKRDSYREKWWIHVEPRPAMRIALAKLDRYIVTTTVSKHRLFVWCRSPLLPDHQLIVIASAADDFLGVLHSRAHETWARSQGTQVRERESGFRYTPTTCFETFPFPEPDKSQREAIAAAARELDRLRNNWLNPPEWVREEVLTFPGTVGGPWSRYIDPTTVTAGQASSGTQNAPSLRPSTIKGEGEVRIGTVRYPRLIPRDEECAKHLAKRTLTNLYNERPTWLDLAHRRLDEAVFAAYGWPSDLTDDELLARLLELNLSRAAAEAKVGGRQSPAGTGS
jgi:type II restriction/modification system DNA methylase subunit YeeA